MIGYKYNLLIFHVRHGVFIVRYVSTIIVYDVVSKITIIYYIGTIEKI